MQYLLIICHDESFVPTEALVTEIVAWDKKMESRGIRKYGNPLRPPSDATTIRVRNGKLMLTDGPFADFKEKMAAYERIECASLNEAIDVASQHPMAKAATVEVRPVWTELANPTVRRPASSGA
jgi:hypothetical protein